MKTWKDLTPEEKQKRVKILKPVAIVIGVIFGISMLGKLCGGNNDKKADENKNNLNTTTTSAKKNYYNIGETVKLKNSEWVILEAVNLGNSLKSQNFMENDATTAGYFIQLKVQITNTSKKEESPSFTYKLYDSKNREFENHSKEWAYISENDQSFNQITGNRQLTPGIPKIFFTIYELPNDAQGLKLEIKDLGFLGDNALIEIDLKSNADSISSNYSSDSQKTPASSENKPMKEPQKQSYNVGEVISLKNSEWIVLEAENMKQSLKSNSDFQKDASTTGYFIKLKVKILNKANKQYSINSSGYKIFDNQNREFEYYDGYKYYIPKDADGLGGIFMGQNNALVPDIERIFYVVYELPLNAKGLKFEIEDIGDVSDTVYVMLGY